jgi:hypothetical protein
MVKCVEIRRLRQGGESGRLGGWRLQEVGGGPVGQDFGSDLERGVPF